MSDKPEDELTGADVFGEPVEGDAVKHREPSHLAGYRPRGRWIRRADGGWFRRRAVDDHPETQDNTRKD